MQRNGNLYRLVGTEQYILKVIGTNARSTRHLNTSNFLRVSHLPCSQFTCICALTVGPLLQSFLFHFLSIPTPARTHNNYDCLLQQQQQCAYWSYKLFIKAFTRATVRSFRLANGVSVLLNKTAQWLIVDTLSTSFTPSTRKHVSSGAISVKRSDTKYQSLLLLFCRREPCNAHTHTHICHSMSMWSCPATLNIVLSL